MDKHLTYDEQNGIHIFTWKSANRRAVDTWLQWMSHIMIRDGKLGYVLIDFTEIGLPPVRYSAMQIRRWLSKHPPIPGGTVVAVRYHARNMPFLIAARSHAFTLGRGRPLTLQFFSDEYEDEAYEWLQEKMHNNARQSG